MSRELINLIIQATGESLFMVSVAALVATALGLPLGIFLATSRKGELFAAPPANGVLGVIVNAARSTPFIILVVAIIPFTRLIAGTSIGSGAAIVPLTIAATPFIARLVEAAIRVFPRHPRAQLIFTGRITPDNRAFADDFSLGGFDGIAQAGVAIVTCMDSRIDPLGMLGLKPGDAKIFRNPGGRVTAAALEALVLRGHEGDVFDGVITSAKEGKDGAPQRGEVMLSEPAVVGALTAQAGELPVGERVRVRLDDVDVASGRIDFALVTD